MDFKFDTYSNDFSDDLLKLPKNCNIEEKCTKFSFCGALRNEKITQES